MDEECSRFDLNTITIVPIREEVLRIEKCKSTSITTRFLLDQTDCPAREWVSLKWHANFQESESISSFCVIQHRVICSTWLLASHWMSRRTWLFVAYKLQNLEFQEITKIYFFIFNIVRSRMYYPLENLKSYTEKNKYINIS